MQDLSTPITILLVFLCILAGLDLWRQYALNSEDYWFTQYSHAIQGRNLDENKFWKFGYRLEDLEDVLINQYDNLQRVRASIESVRSPASAIHPKKVSSEVTSSSTLRDITYPKMASQLLQELPAIRKSRNIIHEILTNDSAVYHIHCENREGPLLRVGENDFRTDPRDQCQLFGSASTSSTIPGPHNMFEKIPIEEGMFALRSVGSRMYVKAVPPPNDHTELPWKLVIGGPVIGAAEKFRLTDDGYLYSSLIGGFFQCATGQMVKGYSSIYGSYNKFLFQPVANEDIIEAQKLVHLSNQIISIQSKYSQQHEISLQARKSAVNLANSASSPAQTRICLGIPMTSKSTVMKDVSESPLWSNLFDSFMKSIDWKANKYIFRFYLGFDKADGLYDTGDAWSEIREEFKRRATFRMKEQLLTDEEANQVLDDKLSLKLMHFDHLEGAPTQVVSQLMLAAFVDGFDYFYQVNDDTVIISPNWTPALIEKLASNPYIPNFGVTGPMDTNNEKIFTHSFVHRTHIEVFGHLFPPSFKNWWSDDWISTVYGPDHTFYAHGVEIKHNVGAQKEKSFTRYEIDQSAQLKLTDELMIGYVQVRVCLISYFCFL
jgi:hypothetical protein